MEQDSSGYAALRERAGAAVRRDVGQIVLTGADRLSYLQGLLTNDVAALTPGSGCYAAMLTAQGRMLTDLRVVELGDAVLLTVPREVAGGISDHLERFVFSEDVRVENVSPAREEVALYGPASAAVLARSGVDVSDAAPLYTAVHARLADADALVIRSDDYGIRGYALIVPGGAASAVLAGLERCGAVPVADEDLEAIRIESGRPRFGADMTTDTIPLEAGIEERALSRTKGCYVGQEVIVRVLDRGHGRVAKRLVGLVLEEGSAVPPADAAVTAAGRDVGHVTSAIESPALRRPVALAYVHRDHAAPGTDVAVAGSGRARVESLPLVTARG